MTARVLLLAIATATLALAAVVPAQAQLRGDEVVDVRFEGNESFPADSLSRAIFTQETSCRSTIFRLTGLCALGLGLRRAPLRQRELELDRARLTIWYQRRGFLEVHVDSAVVAPRGPGQVSVRFRVTEGTPVLADSITFEGLESIEDADDVLRNLPLREGRRLSTIEREATRDTIVGRLRDRGYAHAEVLFRAFMPAADPHGARATFTVVPGPLARYGAIDIQGNEELSLGTVRRSLPFESGDVYRDQDVEDARVRLFGLEIVRSASVEPDLDSAVDSIVPVTVRIREGDKYRMRTGVGWSNADCFSVEARWTSRNFAGGGRVLQLRGRVGNILAAQYGDQLCSQSGSGDFARLTGVAAVDLFQPWIFSTDNSATLSLFAERQTLPDIFVRRAIGLQPAVTRTLGQRSALTLYYRLERSELDADDVLFCTGLLVCTPRDIELLEGANRLAPLGLGFSRDRSDDLLNPRRGTRLFLEYEHAASWTGSNFRYDRVTGEGTWYASLGGPLVLATRLRGGWVGSGGFDRTDDDAIVHPQRRFYAGGANSVRGFRQSRLGPRVLFAQSAQPLIDGGCTPESLVDLSCDAGVAGGLRELPTGGTRVVEGNAEMRFPILSWLEGVAFTDVGRVWGAGEADQGSGLEITPGFGLRFPSPVGPIRVDMAYHPVQGEALSVIAPSLRAYDPLLDDPADRVLVAGAPVPFVPTGDLAVLDLPALFTASASRFQLHVSIGQAF